MVKESWKKKSCRDPIYVSDVEVERGRGGAKGRQGAGRGGAKEKNNLEKRKNIFVVVIQLKF